MNETVYRNFYVGSKIISGRYALETLSFELLQQNARRPLCLIPETEKAVAGTIRKALKSTVTVIGAVLICGRDESDLPEKIAEVYREQNCDSLIAVAEASLMCAVKSARLKLSAEKTAAEIGRTAAASEITELPPQQTVPLFAVAVPSVEATYYPHELNLGEKRILSPALFANTVFVDPRITKKASARKEWRKPAAAALMTAVWALSDMQSHPAARACALSAIGQVCEALTVRSRAEQTRLVCNAQIFSKTALINSRPFPAVELLPLIPVSEEVRIGILKTVFEKELTGLSFGYADLTQAVLTLCGTGPFDNSSPQTVKNSFTNAVSALLEKLFPGKPAAGSVIWKQTAEALPSSYLNDTDLKNECLAFLQSQIGE